MSKILSEYEDEMRLCDDLSTFNNFKKSLLIVLQDSRESITKASFLYRYHQIRVLLDLQTTANL